MMNNFLNRRIQLNGGRSLIYMSNQFFKTNSSSSSIVLNKNKMSSQKDSSAFDILDKAMAPTSELSSRMDKVSMNMSMGKKFSDLSLDHKKKVIKHFWFKAREEGYDLPEEIEEKQWRELLSSVSYTHLSKTIK